MDDEMSENRRVIDRYISELQSMSFIRQTTTEEQHEAHLRRLQKLQQKVAKVKDRLDRLRKHRDPNYANSQIDTGLLKTDDDHDAIPLRQSKTTSAYMTQTSGHRSKPGHHSRHHKSRNSR